MKNAYSLFMSGRAGGNVENIEKLRILDSLRGVIWKEQTHSCFPQNNLFIYLLVCLNLIYLTYLYLVFSALLSSFVILLFLHCL